MVSKPTFRNLPLQVIEDCLYQSVGDLVHELQRTMKKFLWKMELRELQRKVEECRRKMHKLFGKEFRRKQQQTMLALHSVQKPHAPHHHHNVKTQPLYSQIRCPIKPSSPSSKSIHPSLGSRKHQMQHFKCTTNHHVNCQLIAKPWSVQLQISTHLNLVSDYHGVKAKNEGVFDCLIRKYIYTESIFLQPWVQGRFKEGWNVTCSHY